MISIHPQYITDQSGNKISAVLPIKEFKNILDELEDLEDIKLYDESKKDKKTAISMTKALELIAKERKKLGK
jgi:hypothetical protein